MAVITVNQNIDNIDSFISNIKNLSKSYYVFVGRPNEWPDDSAPPAATQSVEQTELSIYRDIVYGKLIANTDVAYMIRRISWANNTVYDQYSQDRDDAINCNCYVITNAGVTNDVYKCIYNNSNAASTVKPSLTSVDGTFKTADGYIWKYMYSVETGAYNKFATNSYIPITVNNAVEEAAVPGTIDYIEITNPGNNYQIYETGYLLNVANNGYIVFLPNTAAQIDNYYVGSSIYLKAGGGAGQLRNIELYSGLDRSLKVEEPFDVYVNLNLSNPYGSNLEVIEVGDIVTQNSVDIGHYYDSGSFGVGNNIIQSDTGATGVIVLANSSHFILTKNNASSDFIIDLPFYNTASAPVLKTGTVTITAGSNSVIGVGTSFTSLAANDYVMIGNTSTAAQYIRRITSITNNTLMYVDANTTSISAPTALKANLTSVAYYSVPSASTPTSVGIINRYGAISYKNVNGIKIGISNTTPSGKLFSSGELVKQVDANGTYQAAEAIVAYANSSSLELTSVVGTFQQALYVRGESSNLVAYISSSTSFPNITVENPVGTFEPAQPIYVENQLGTIVANAVVLSTIVTPNMLTEYIISPKVTIEGDGNGALAYAYVDTSINNPTREIGEIVIINPGNNYTTANVTITSNAEFGDGATAKAAISPILGHGANAYVELASKYAGISMTFSNGDIEGFKFPVTGKFRRVGILEDPTFNDATVTLNAFDRVNLYIGNSNSTFQVGEIAYQPNTGVAGIVAYANTINSTAGYLELMNVRGNTTFTTADGLPFFAAGNSAASNDANTQIIGLTSGATANVLITQIGGLANSSVSYFRILSDIETVTEIGTGAMATISQVISNTQIRLSNIKGHFAANDTLYDAVTNASANVVSITIANDSIDATTDFGHKFTQTCRIPLTTNNGVVFLPNEKVIQDTTNGTGYVLTYNVDIDIVLTANAVDVNTGDYLSCNTTGQAVALVSNGTYIKCTAGNGTFSVGETLMKNGNTVVGVITQVNPALVLYNTYNIFDTSFENEFRGQTSGASGLNTVEGTIWFPELVRDSGAVCYIENIMPFERSNASSEKVNIIIKF